MIWFRSPSTFTCQMVRGAGNRNCDTRDLHTRLYELGTEGQLRHWYLMPMIG